MVYLLRHASRVFFIVYDLRIHYLRTYDMRISY